MLNFSLFLQQVIQPRLWLVHTNGNGTCYETENSGVNFGSLGFVYMQRF